MSRMAWLVTLMLLLTACSPKAAPPAAPPPQSAPPAAAPEPVAPPEPAPPETPPPAPPPRTFRQVPEVLARPVKDGGPQRVALAAGDTVGKTGAYFLDVETGVGEAWIYTGSDRGWWTSSVSDDNRFVRISGDGEGYLIDRPAGAVWQWDGEAVWPLLTSDRGFLFAERERKDLNLENTGRYFWTDPDFKPLRTFVLEGKEVGATAALLSPDGQQLALLGGGRRLVLLDLRSGAQKALEVPGAERWVGTAGMTAKNGGIEVSAWVSPGPSATNMPRWTQLIRLYDWQGQVQDDLQIPGSYTFFSPDGKWVAWQEPDLLGSLAPITVVAEASSLKPHLKVLGASTCFSSVGSGGTRWLADSSALVLSTTDSQYRLLRLDGHLSEPPGFAGLLWKGEPQPAPDKVDRFALGRVRILDGARQLELKLEGHAMPRADAAWGISSHELRFTLPAKPGGGACYELPAMEPLVLRGDEPVPEFPLIVRGTECIPLQDDGMEAPCLAPGTRLKPLPAPNGRPSLIWTQSWRLYVMTAGGQTGWISLSPNPLTWAR